MKTVGVNRTLQTNRTCHHGLFQGLLFPLSLGEGAKALRSLALSLSTQMELLELANVSDDGPPIALAHLVTVAPHSAITVGDDVEVPADGAPTHLLHVQCWRWAKPTLHDRPISSA